jgi:two-component system, sensor histidine kinase and response regulator
MGKILLIEDEVQLLEEVAEWLQFEGYTAYQATNGSEGVELARKELPDLILCDVMMPGLDGYRVLLELRARAETAVTPFIFITALSDRGDLRRGMDMGADDYITKPFTRDELLRAVDSRLTRQSVSQKQTEDSLNELRKSIMHTLPHEMRTPLTGILGFGEMLSHSPEWFTPTELKEVGRLILDSGKRLLRMIENYQFYVELQLRRDMPAKVGEPAETDAALLEIGQRLSIKYHRENDLLVMSENTAVNLSVSDWERLITELIDNAFKFSAAGTPVQVIGQAKERTYHLRVSDKGRGIHPANIGKIGPYMQFDRKQYEQQGSGMGLAIAQILVELADGELSIESALEEGTAVSVTIPIY